MASSRPAVLAATGAGLTVRFWASTEVIHLTIAGAACRWSNLPGPDDSVGRAICRSRRCFPTRPINDKELHVELSTPGITTSLVGARIEP
jgi:hypothetical protein